MATIAIELDRSFELPDTPAVPRARKTRAQKHGRFASKTVRLRNEGAGKPWWQPSSPSWRPKPSRAMQLAVALKEELETDPEVTDTPVVAYSDCARFFEHQRVNEEGHGPDLTFHDIGQAFRTCSHRLGQRCEHKRDQIRKMQEEGCLSSLIVEKELELIELELAVQDAA